MVLIFFRKWNYKLTTCISVRAARRHIVLKGAFVVTRDLTGIQVTSATPVIRCSTGQMSIKATWINTEETNTWVMTAEKVFAQPGTYKCMFKPNTGAYLISSGTLATKSVLQSIGYKHIR